MTMIRCPACAHRGDVARSIEDTDFDWSCPGCCKTFEVRTVFLRRHELVDKNAFVAQVRREIEDQGLTQAELGRLVGVSGAYISTILSGRRQITKDLADRVTAALRLPGHCHPADRR